LWKRRNAVELEFPWWLRITHYINIVFLFFLIRSGIEILASHPKLYWNDHSKPGSEWARFTRKTMPKDKLYDTLDEEESYSSVVAMPGHKELGLGRHWHFFSVIVWVLTGVSYVALLFIDDQWRHLIPTSWSVFPEAWQAMLSYLSFQLPEHEGTYNALQQLAYFSVVFLLAPFMILTGAAQSPALEARFPWYVRMWGGRQWARSLHFFGLLAFLAFVVGHVLMVVVHGFGKEMTLMVYGRERPELATSAAVIGIIGIIGVVAIHVAATKLTLARKRGTQKALGAVVEGARKVLLHPLESKQDYSRAELSPEHRVNGKPPDADFYKVMAVHNFADYRLEVGGLVENPMTFTLEDLRTFPTKQTQRVLHNCIQGWTSIGEWSGVPLRQIVKLVKPLPEARHIVFLTMQDNGRDEPSSAGEGQFYETIDLDYAYHPQCILAYEMNGGPLPIKHGAPLRLRLETQVGFKMAKWIERIEFVSDYSGIGEGMGGWREDNVYFDRDVGI
jgi:DMSO/TMAO reductase YedYZ molybdopterin-dependent catalytic subunit/thiosulfate reductase cytochrome b subunit